MAEKSVQILEYGNGLIHGELTLSQFRVSLSESFNLLPYIFSPLISSVRKDEKFMLFLIHKINLKIPGTAKTFNKNERLVSFHGMNENI